MSGMDARPAGNLRHPLTTQFLLRVLVFGGLVLLLSFGLASLLSLGDPRVLHASLANDIAHPLAAGDLAEIQRRLSQMQAEGRISDATVSDARGEVIARIGTAVTDGQRMRIDGPVTFEHAAVGALSLGVLPPDRPSTLLPALLIIACCLLLMRGMRLREERLLALQADRLEQGLQALSQRRMADIVRLEPAHPLSGLAEALAATSSALAGERSALEERLQRLLRIIDAHDEAGWEWPLDSRQIWYSTRFPTLLGYPDDDSFRQQFNWSAATHPDDAAIVRRTRERLLAGEIERSDDQIRLRVRDGTYRWFRLRACADTRAEDGVQRLSGTLEDVTRERMTLDALRESEARLFHAVRGSFDGAWDWDIVAGRYFLSPRLSELLGLPQSMQPQTHEQLLERVHPDDLPHLEHAIDEHFLRRESFDIEYRMRHEDGHYLWVRDRGLATRGSNGKVLRFSGSITDITERKLAEHEVVKLAADKQALLDDVPVAIVYVRDGVIADCNRRCEEIFGHGQDDLIGRTVGVFFPVQSDLPDLPDLLDGATRSAPQPYANESVLQRHDGALLHAYVSVRLAEQDTRESIWIFSDDTARRKALDSARREEHFSAALVHSMPGAFFLLDSRGVLRRWNENLQGTTGRSAKELEGMRALDLFQPECHDLLRRQARRALTHHDATFEADLLDVAGAGRTHAFSLYRIDLDGSPYILGTGLDIRARKEAERGVLALNQQLEARVRERTAELLTAMRELESFSYSVSHDLAAPLRGIDGFSRMIEEDYAELLDDRGRDHIRRIRAATQRMHRLIDDLLGLARITRNEMNRQSVDISQMADDISSELRRAEPDRQAEFLIQPSMRVYADANLLRIAIDNLLRNAWKFTGRNAAARIEVGCLPRGRELVYFVKDDGAGFDMRYASKLFGPFQRLHSAGEFSGSGIGLAIVHRVVLRHGGRIWAEAEVERGACFYFTLAPVSH
jgi:PAS domain S-box-containing protein